MEISALKDKVLRFFPFYRWHPEVALRYLPVVSEVKRESPNSVLEVGSGGLGIAPYLGREVTGADTQFSLPIHPFLKPVKVSGAKLPFADKSFDLVISVDTLEHINPRDRKAFLQELFRVAKKEVILAFPTGTKAAQQDEELARAYRGKFKTDFPFFTEHEKYGLPDKEEVLKIIKTTVPKARVTEEDNEGLGGRKFLMRGWMTKNFFAGFFYRKILLFFLPVLEYFNREPYYRVILFIHL